MCVKSFYIGFYLLTRFLFVDLFYFGGLFQEWGDLFLLVPKNRTGEMLFGSIC